MATRYLPSKFDSYRPVLQDAVRGIKDLRYNQKVYKKIYKYYKDLGINFIGDSASDYDAILDLLYDDGIE